MHVHYAPISDLLIDDAGSQTKQPSTLLLNQRIVELRGGCGSARSQAETPDSTDASTPFSGRNELFRVTSFRYILRSHVGS